MKDSVIVVNIEYSIPRGHWKVSYKHKNKVLYFGCFADTKIDKFIKNLENVRKIYVIYIYNLAVSGYFYFTIYYYFH